MIYFFHNTFVDFYLSAPVVMHNRYYLDVVPVVTTPHLLHTIILATGLVCNKAEQIESASQLKCHTYLIRPVIQGYALLPLHNTFSTFVTSAHKAVLYCHFTYCKLRPAPPQATAVHSQLLAVIVWSSLWGTNTKVHITHIITYALLCKCTHSRSGEKDT